MKACRRRNAAYKELPSGKRTDEKVSYRRLLFVNISRFRLTPSVQAILLPPRQFVLPGYAALSATHRPLCRKRRQIFAGFLLSPVPGGLYSVLFPAKRREFTIRTAAFRHLNRFEFRFRCNGARLCLCIRVEQKLAILV